jgi:DDE family transposase
LTGITPVLEAAMVPFAGLLAALEQIPDPRRRQGRRYPLAHLLLFSVLAVLAGATSYRGILVFITVHRERLNAVFGTTLRRAPAVNTLRALLQALDPAALEAAFRQHARELSEAAPTSGPRVIALDGKTLKRSFDHLNDKAAAHVLSAFACEAALILAHQEVRGAPEEIPAVQTLIEALGVRGVLFTADALHGQKKPSRARRAPAMPFWSGSRPTSRACTMPSSACAPSRSPSASMRPSTAAVTVARSIVGSSCSRLPVGFRQRGGV